MGSQSLPEVPLRCSSLERENRFMDRDNLDLNDPSAGNNRVTACGRNRGSGRNLDPKYLCQICEDIAVGYHCGAFICEACKKFYLRCMKSGLQSSFTCAKSRTCEINKDTRSHCQYCRFQKCIQVGMFKSGRNESKSLKVDFSSIPCKVCDAPSSGFHFGSITCEGCKGFFRRTVNEDNQHPVVCVSGGNCLIGNSNNRVACKACRFARCKAVGMTLAGTRLGRQSNSVKRTTIMQYNLERQAAAAAAQAGGAPSIAVVTESSNSNLMPEDGESKGDENIVEPIVSGRRGGKKTGKAGRPKKKSQDDNGGMLTFEEGDLNLLSGDLSVDAVSIAKRHEIEAFLNRSDMQQWNASNGLAARSDAQVIGKLEAGFRGGEVVHSTPPVPLPSYWKTAANSFDNPALPAVDNFEWFPRKPVGDSYRLEDSRGSGIAAPSTVCNYSSSRPYGQLAPNSVGYYGLQPGVMQQQQAYNVRAAPAPQQFVPAARGVPLEPPFGTEERLWQEPRMYEAVGVESSLLDNAADRGRRRFTYSEVEQHSTRLPYATADVRRYYAGDEEKLTPYEVSPFVNATTPYGVSGQDIWAYPKVEPLPATIGDTGKAWQQTAVPHPSTAPFPAPSHLSKARVDGSNAAAAVISYRHSIDLTNGAGYNLDLSTRGLSVAHSIDSILTEPVVANIATESNVNRSRALSGDQDKVTSPEERKTLIQFTAKRAAIRPSPPLAFADCDVKNVPKLPVTSCLKTEQTVFVPPVVIKTEVDEQPLCLVSPTSIESPPLTMEIKSPATSDVCSNQSLFERCIVSPGEGDSSSQGYLSGEDGTASSSGVGSPYVKELHEAVLDMPAFQDIQILREGLARAWHVLDCIIVRPIELEEYKPDYEDRSSVWNLAALSFMHHIKSVLKFVKQVPGFTSLPVEDQIIMVQISSYPLSLLYHTQFYNLETGECNFFINTLEEYEFVMAQFPHFRGLVHHFQHTGQMLKAMNVTDVEYGLMAVISLFLAGVKPYEKTVQVLINFFTDMLLEYCEETSDDPCRGGNLLLRLGELYKFNCDHLSIAMKSSAENPDVDFSQLWHEMFLDY